MFVTALDIEDISMVISNIEDESVKKKLNKALDHINKANDIIIEYNNSITETVE